MQGKQHPWAPQNLPMDCDGFLLPAVQAAPCPLQPTVPHCTQLVFILISALKENDLLCSYVLGKVFFLLAKSKRVVPVSISGFPLPSGLPAGLAGRPPPARVGGSAARPPAPQPWCGNPFRPALLTDVPASCSGSFTGSWSRCEGCEELMLNC